MRILVTGGHGFIGKALVPKLLESGHEVLAPTRRECDFSKSDQVEFLFRENDFDAVIHLAGKVGGILANKRYPAEFMYENLSMNTVFLDEARRAGIKRLIYSFCGCSYSSSSQNPIREDTLFTGLPDENAMYYSIGKATSHFQILAYRKEFGLDWVSLVPGNVYGPFDDFSEENSHVIPGLIRKFYNAKKQGLKSVTAWGTGSPVRDFVFVEDVADAFIRALDKHHDPVPINVSGGIGISIRELVNMVSQEIGYEGRILWDQTKPDGHPIKIFDVSRMKSLLDFEPKVSLTEGIRKTVKWFESNYNSIIEGENH